MSPKDEEIIDWLVKEKAFSPKAALKCLTTFKETMRFAGINWPSDAAAQPTICACQMGNKFNPHAPNCPNNIEHNDH